MALETVPSTYRKLSNISNEYQVRANCPLIAINHNDYFIVARTAMDSNERSQSIKLMKYSSTTDKWQEFLSDFEVSGQSDSRHLCHVSDGRLYMVQDNNLQSIDLNTGSSTFRGLSFDFLFQCILSLDEQVYVFGRKYCGNYHYMIDTVTGTATKRKITGIENGDLSDFSYPIHQKSRDRIIICSTSSRGQILVEYSLQTQQYSSLNWSRLKFMFVSGLVSSLDERYIVGFGGYYRRERLDQIIVFDFKTQTVFKSEIKCPLPLRYHTVSLGNKEMDELAVFGFINQSYKDQNLRNVQSLPVHVAQMMCKWYCNERVALMAHSPISSRSGHWSVNLDEIIRLKAPIKK